MAEEVAQVSQEGLGYILVHAMLAARNVRAQRDRILQLRRLLQPRSPGDDDATGVQEVAYGLHKVYSVGLQYGSVYLVDCLETAAEKGDGASFSIPAFTVIPDEQLYRVLLTQRFPPRPTSQAQAQAFARIESAYYAVMLSLDHHLPRCIELLVGVRPPAINPKPPGRMIGYSDDPVAAAHEYLLKSLETGFPDPDPAPAAAAKPPEEKSSVDLDQALSYLHRAFSLTTLAVQHLDVSVAFISSFLHPDDVAEFCERADERVYISEDGPYPSENSD